MPAVSVQPTQSIFWEDYATQRNGQWKPISECDQLAFDFVADVGGKDAADDPGFDARSHLLTADEAAQVLIIGASRVKATGPKVTLPYRKLNPLGELWVTLNSGHFFENIKNVAPVVVLVAGAMFFLQSPAVHKIQTATSSLPALHQKAVARHVVAKAASAISTNLRPARVWQPTSRPAWSQSSPALQPEVVQQPTVRRPSVLQPVAEYKGPSSVTGITPPHRRAYQTASMIVRPVQ